MPCLAEKNLVGLVNDRRRCLSAKMKIGHILFTLLIALAVLGIILFLVREPLLNLVLKQRLQSILSTNLEAEVQLEHVCWENGQVEVARCRVTDKNLSLGRLEATGVQLPLSWRDFLGGTPRSWQIKAKEVVIVWRQPVSPKALNSEFPQINLVVENLTFQPEGKDTWRLQGVSSKITQENGLWSYSGRGGILEIFGHDPLPLNRLSVKKDGGVLSIGNFALGDETTGILAGSALQEDGTWEGEFSWQDFDFSSWLPVGAAAHFEGRASGDAVLRNGQVEGRMKITGGVSKTVPQFVTMASLFAGENWDNLPWDILRFDFVRQPDGTVGFSNLKALSPQGIVIHGAGEFAPDRLKANLQLGVSQEGRPWLTAFVPILFRKENNGYLWTTVRVRGTPEAPIEDLSGRVVAALVSNPINTAVETAAELPDSAVEAAGSLLRILLGD